MRITINITDELYNWMVRESKVRTKITTLSELCREGLTLLKDKSN